MTEFLNPDIPLKEKPHPWERNIKHIYSSTYKYAHNSVNNPVYPPKKERQADAINRVKFTIIGNIVAEDFIYSVKLVKLLHKYRWKRFDTPVIKGVTSVEWPNIWNDLKAQHGGLAYCLTSQLAVLTDDKLLGGITELKELIDSKYRYHLNVDYYKEGVDQFARYIRSSGRPCAYMHMSIKDKHIGTFIFMLYSDIVPLTCENFLRLCKTNKGGYSGTPIHRIVKDCWIQCGGFGLKSTSLECENFIVPHDRRGVLCMANDGRHVDCSTQFFVLLQPAPWMAHKYVAFGQLIDGEDTLKKIETVQTWYEAPTTPIIIFEAGILNMDCHGITINKGTNAYIRGHIEDLVALGELFYESVLERVFMEIELKSMQRVQGEGDGDDEVIGDEDAKNIRATKRFMRKKEEIEQQLENVSQRSENNEYDVELYEYEPEEFSYQHPAGTTTISPVAKPEKPYYLALTDVPYPGETDSTYDLKKMLQGDYCLESDLEKHAPKKALAKVYLPLNIFDMVDEEIDEELTDESSESEETVEFKKYLENNADQISFGESLIKKIARNANAEPIIFEGTRKSRIITDEELRRLRLATEEYQHQQHKKVSISLPTDDKGIHAKIKRRQTGFVHPKDLERIHIYRTSSDEDEPQRKVRIVSSAKESHVGKDHRRPTACIRATESLEPDQEPVRPSVLARLYDEYTCDDDAGPTLKDYKPVAQTHNKNLLFLTSSARTRIKHIENDHVKYNRLSVTMEDSLNQFLNIQHGKKVSRKISTDYVKTIDQIERRPEYSIRSIEFAKRRPTITVTEYQMKNQMYHDQLKAVAAKLNEGMDNISIKSSGLRLPGDTPLYVPSFASYKE